MPTDHCSAIDAANRAAKPGWFLNLPAPGVALLDRKYRVAWQVKSDYLCRRV